MNHKELDVWKLSIELVVDIYKQTRDFPDNEKYGLVSQMRRSAVSIPSNIAEGAGRIFTNEYKQFLSYSKGSAAELETQLIISGSLKYLNKNTIDELLNKLVRVIKMLSVMIEKK